MNVLDIIKNANSFIGDSSTDRISTDERYQSITEATAWLLEELGNEHMTDRVDIQFLPTVMWYKMDNLTPYLLTAGQLRFETDSPNREDFTRVEPRDLATMPKNRHAYAIERYNGDSFLGIVMPEKSEFPHKDLIPMNNTETTLTYVGINATNILKEKDGISFDMTASGPTSTGLSVTTETKDLSEYSGEGVLVFEVEIPDITGITSVSMRFGTNLATDYYLGTVTQDVGGNTLSPGLNIIKIKWSELTIVGTPNASSVTKWQWNINHLNTKPIAYGFKLSDTRIVKPVPLTFKYLFYRVGKSVSGVDIIEFTADSDVPFFVERYPQYRFAVAHKAASVLFRILQLYDNVKSEDREATKSLDRFRKNFSGERDMPSSAFKIAGINLRQRRIVRRK